MLAIVRNRCCCLVCIDMPFFFFSFGIFASSNGGIDSVICKLMKSACRLFVYQPDIGIGVVVV